jgi:F-type H+-transporting ATPase subunit b
MAEEKIASAERAVLAEIRGKAAEAAATAARALVAEKHGAAADKALVDSSIASLGRPH